MEHISVRVITDITFIQVMQPISDDPKGKSDIVLTSLNKSMAITLTDICFITI